MSKLICLDCNCNYSYYDDLNWTPTSKWTCDEEETRCRCGCDKMVTIENPCGRCKSCQFKYVKTVELKNCTCCKYDFCSINGASECKSCEEWVLHFCTVCNKNYECKCLNEFGKCDGCLRFCSCPCTITDEVKQQQEIEQKQLETECAEYNALHRNEESM